MQTRVQTHPKAHPFTNLRTQLGCQPEQSPTASYGLWVPGGMVAVFQGRASPQKGHDFYDLASGIMQGQLFYVLFTDSHKVPPKFKGRRNRLPLDGEQQGFRRACGMRDIVRTCNCHRRRGCENAKYAACKCSTIGSCYYYPDYWKDLAPLCITMSYRLSIAKGGAGSGVVSIGAAREIVQETLWDLSKVTQHVSTQCILRQTGLGHSCLCC